MMKSFDRFFALALSAALCLAASTAAHGQRRSTRDGPQSADGAAAEQADGDDYSILETRNIFMRDRSAPRTRTRPQPAQPRPAPRPERDIVLTGVVRRDGEYVAFFENRRSGETSRLRVGEALLRGRVAAIALDHVLYEMEGRSAQVGLGMDLDGAAAGSAATTPSDAPAAGPAPDGPATTEPSAAPSGAAEDRASVLERLRQRRQQEMNR